MQVIASLRRRTKNGISVWHFCYDNEINRYFAVGGDRLEVKPCVDRNHLRQMHDNFVRYGYKRELPPLKPKAKPMGPISDPWESSLPLKYQLELDALAA